MTECSLTMLSPTPPLDDAEEPILAVSSHAYIDSVDAIRRALAEESDADSETEDGDTPGASTGPVRAIEAVAPSRASVLAWFAYGLGDTLWMATAAAVLFVLDNSEYPSSSSSSSSAPPSAAWDVLWAVIAVVVTQAAAALGDRRGVHRALVCALGILGALALLAAGLALASHPRAAHLLLGAGQAAVLAARTLYDAQIPFVLAPAFRTLWQGICAVLGLAGALPPALWLLWRALAPASAPAPVALAISAALVHLLLLALYACHGHCCCGCCFSCCGCCDCCDDAQRDGAPPASSDAASRRARKLANASRAHAPRNGNDRNGRRRRRKGPGCCRETWSVLGSVLGDRDGLCVLTVGAVALAGARTWASDATEAFASAAVPAVVAGVAVFGGCFLGAPLGATHGCRASLRAGLILMLGADALLTVLGEARGAALGAAFAAGAGLGTLASSLRMLRVQLAAPPRVAQTGAVLRAGGVLVAAVAEPAVRALHSALADDAALGASNDAWRAVFAVRALLAALALAAAHQIVDPARLYDAGLRAPYETLYLRSGIPLSSLPSPGGGGGNGERTGTVTGNGGGENNTVGTTTPDARRIPIHDSDEPVFVSDVLL